MMFQVDNLAFGYPGGGRSLADITFSINRGEVTCILGPNGAGKTTLIRCLLGSLSPRGGTVRIGGISTRDLDARQLARKVAHVPQSTHSVFGHLVADIVLMGRSPHLSMLQAPSPHDREIAAAALEQVGIAHLARREYATISGGERQLCLLARALAQEAPILIMDEPAASLDYGNQIRILDIIATLAGNGFAVLMTTHHPDHALLVGTQVIGLQEGRVFGLGHPAELLSSDFLSCLYGAPVRLIQENGTRACVPVLTNMIERKAQQDA